MLDFGFISIPLLYVHLAAAGCLVLLVMFADHEAYQWMTGKKETLNKKTLRVVHYLTYAGLAVMLTTGIAMALPLKDYLLTVPAFYLKMFFVLALLVNSLFIGAFMSVPAERAFASLSFKEKLPLLISGAVSTGSWIGVIICAFNLGL